MKDQVLKPYVHILHGLVFYKTFIHMLWLWLTLEWHTRQLTLNTPFKLDVISVNT